jgi:hypothetical protein
MEEKMPMEYRAARLEDIPACVDLFIESVTDLARRHNLPDHEPSRDRMLAFYRHALVTGVFHVAELDGRPAALACALLRDHLWFLAGFWVRPGLQQQHIGMPVLRRAWEDGKQAGCSHFFVWSSMDLPAMAAYMKLGMLPGTQILAFEGAPQRPPVPADYTAVPLKPSFAMAMDETVLGSRREVDHQLMSRLGWLGRQVQWQGRNVGYYYLDGGSIGPAAWIGSEHAAPLLALACREGLGSNDTVILRVGGMNHAAIRFAFDVGLRLTGFSHLLMTASFAHLEQYVPSGPAIF